MDNGFFHFQIQSARVGTFVLGVFLAKQPLLPWSVTRCCHSVRQSGLVEEELWA
jgi:hypothetical protein